MTPVRIAALLLTALTMTSCSEETALRRGAFAFHYSSSLSRQEIDWYSRFDILVTHDPLPLDQVDELRRAGTKLVLYEWSVAFYESLATDWQKSLLPSRRGLLNPTPLTGGLGSASSGAWYFDPATAEHEEHRAGAIARRIEAAGYDGVFLDTTTFESVHPRAKEIYQQRHPDLPYDAAFARFLARLRRALPKGIIFTNQGYRSADFYLPYVDWDLTESFVTRPAGQSFEQRPWNAPANPWNSTFFLMRTLIEPAAARYPKVRFGHLNYAAGGVEEIILLVQATAQLFGGEGFVAAPSISGEISDIYFRDPGQPLAKRVDAADGMSSYRFFTNGLIAVTASREPLKIGTERALRDRVTGDVACGQVVLPPSDGTPRAFFFDVTNACE